MRVCEQCGGGNISRKVFQDINDGSIIETVNDDVHCWDCADLTGDIDAYEYKRQQDEYDADSAADAMRDDALERAR